MTIWTPELETGADQPLYQALTAAIGRSIETGELAPGERLPTQRALAAELGIALSTVTRGYGEAERRGWIRSDVGRGTFVLGATVESEEPAEPGVADLRPNVLHPFPFERELRETATRAVRDASGADLFDYGAYAGRPRHRETGARLFRDAGVAATADRVLVTVGVQHAMTLAFATLVPRGGALLVEDRTYAGIKPLAELLGIRLVPVAMDREGMLPDSLAREAKRSGARVVYTMPVLQNPTGAVMSRARVAAIARTAAKAGLVAIEDDTYGFLLPDAPRLAAVLPDAYCLVGTSKSLVPSIRTGYLLAPRAALPKLEAAAAGTVYFTSPITAEIASECVASGLYDRVTAWKRDEFRARQAMALETLGRFGYAPHEASAHGWLELPAGWTAERFVARAAQLGVVLPRGESFAAGDCAPAVRVVVGSVPSRPALARALGTIASLLERGPESGEVMA